MDDDVYLFGLISGRVEQGLTRFKNTQLGLVGAFVGLGTGIRKHILISVPL